MKAARIYGPRDLRLVDMTTPEPGPGEVLCKVRCCGICGTDYAIYTGDYSFIQEGLVKFPMTPGHEWSGVVEKVGSGVESFQRGDRVVGDTVVACGNCYECLMGQYYSCKHLRCVGTIHTWDGAYAEYILMPARHLFALPDTVSFENGAWIEPAATGLYSVMRAGVKIGDTVLIQGAGPIGITAAKAAKLAGASKVAIADRKQFNLQAALDLGVDAAIDTGKNSLPDAVTKHFGSSGVDCIVEATGSTELLQDALRCLKNGGSLAVVAMYEKPLEMFHIDRFVCNNITMRAVVGSLGAYRPILQLMAAGLLDFTPLITGRYRLENIESAMQDMRKKDDTRIKMMIEF